MMRRLVPLLASAGLLATAGRVEAQTAPRAMIYVALVTPADVRAKDALLDWGTAFKFGLDPLITEIAAAKPGSVAPQINLVSVNQAPSVAMLRALSDEGQAVQVSSAISQWSSSYSTISMTIYLGALKGGLVSPVLMLRQKVVADSFRADQDALALVALYAWGNEALRSNPVRNRVLACGFFGRARLIGVSIAATVPEVASVRQAIDKGLGDNKCGPR